MAFENGVKPRPKLLIPIIVLLLALLAVFLYLIPAISRLINPNSSTQQPSTTNETYFKLLGSAVNQSPILVRSSTLPMVNSTGVAEENPVEIRNDSNVVSLPALPSEMVSGDNQKFFWPVRWSFNDSKVCSLFNDDLLKGLCLIESAGRSECVECCDSLLAKSLYNGTLLPYSIGSNTVFINPAGSGVNSSVFWSLCITSVAGKTGDSNICSKLSGDFATYCNAYVKKDEKSCRFQDSFITAKCYRSIMESTPPESVLMDAQGYGRLW